MIKLIRYKKTPAKYFSNKQDKEINKMHTIASFRSLFKSKNQSWKRDVVNIWATSISSRQFAPDKTDITAIVADELQSDDIIE